MSFADQNNPYASFGLTPAIAAAPDARAAFLRNTYLHVFGAVAAFTGLQVLLFTTPMGNGTIGSTFAGALFGGLGQLTWALVLIGFMVVTFVANRMAMSSTSKATQYAGLGLYVLAEAVIFTPLIYIALTVEPSAIMVAAIATLVIFGCLTAGVLMTGADFRWLQPILSIAFGVAILVIFVSIFMGGFGPNFAFLFAIGMVVLLAGSILAQTSTIMRDYPTDMYVAASLGLFAALMTMFWYILQIVLSLMSSD
jgi:FtsH-binding integral membrane protein